MANTVDVLTQVDGERNHVVTLFFLSDGVSNLTATSLVDVSALNTTEVRLASIKGFINNSMTLTLLWDATTDAAIFSIGEVGSIASGVIDIDFTDGGRLPGIKNTKATGWTGDVVMATAGIASGDTCFFQFHFLKA